MNCIGQMSIRMGQSRVGEGPDYPALELLRSIERSKKGEGRKGKGKGKKGLDARYYIEESTDVLRNKHCFICSNEGHELRECPNKHRKSEFEREVRKLYDDALAEWRETNGDHGERTNGMAAHDAAAANGDLGEGDWGDLGGHPAEELTPTMRAPGAKSGPALRPGNLMRVAGTATAPAAVVPGYEAYAVPYNGRPLAPVLAAPPAVTLRPAPRPYSARPGYPRPAPAASRSNRPPPGMWGLPAPAPAPGRYAPY